MRNTTSELCGAMLDIDQIATELDALNTLFAYLVEEIDANLPPTGDSAKATAFVGRIATFSKMLFAVSTGMTTQIKALEESVNTGYDCVKTLKEEAKHE